jgi:uncharacterized protein (DUF934 family)
MASAETVTLPVLPVIADIVIDRTGQPISNAWTTLAAEAPLPEAGPVILPLARLLAEPASLALQGGIGALIGPEDDLAALAPLLSKLALVAIAFPKFRDGRGFTQMRALREHRGYTGEIRATGHPLPDQFLNLVRCGVTSVDLPQGQDAAVWVSVLKLHGGLDTRPVAERPLPLLRRLAVPFAP